MTKSSEDKRLEEGSAEIASPGETLGRVALILATVAAGATVTQNDASASTVVPSLNRDEIKQLAEQTGIKLTVRTQSGAIVDAIGEAALQSGDELAQGGYSKVHDRSGGHDKVGGYTFRHHDDDQVTHALPNWRGDVFVAEINAAELERLKSAKLNIVRESDIDLLNKYGKK